MELKSKTAVLAEDDEILNEVYQGYLESVAFGKIFPLEDGLSAKKILSEQKVDFLFSDFEMPGLNGIELCRWAIQNIPGIKILLNSGKSIDDFLEILSESQTIVFLSKPFTYEQFKQAMELLFKED